MAKFNLRKRGWVLWDGSQGTMRVRSKKKPNKAQRKRAKKFLRLIRINSALGVENVNP